jgi:hypothetical protein
MVSIPDCIAAFYTADDSWDGTQFVFEEDSNSDNSTAFIQRYGSASVTVFNSPAIITSGAKPFRDRGVQVSKPLQRASISIQKFDKRRNFSRSHAIDKCKGQRTIPKYGVNCSNTSLRTASDRYLRTILFKLQHGFVRSLPR